jgi:hypothetical protein
VVKRGAITGLSGKCVDVRSGNRAEGTPIDLFPCNATAAQEWIVGADGSLRALGKCMTAPPGGTAAELRSCNGSPQQQWNPQLDRSLVNAASGRCLELPGGKTDDFTILAVATCTGSPAQQWKLPA